MSQEAEQTEDFTALYAKLIALAAAQSTIDEVGEVIRQFPKLYALPPSPSLLHHLEETQITNGVEPDKMWFPELHGTLIEGGFAPALFTSVDFAHHIAKINNHIPEGTAIMIQGMSTPHMLMARLVAGAAGLIIDGGQPHKVCLTSWQISRITAIANRTRFANEPDLITLRNVRGEPVFTTQGVTQVLCFDESVNSEVVREFLRDNFGIKDITFSQEPALTIIRDGLASGAKQLTVNPGLHTCRVYSAADMHIMNEK